MDKEQAWKLINDVCSQFRGTRQDHMQIQMALEAIKPVSIECAQPQAPLA